MRWVDLAEHWVGDPATGKLRQIAGGATRPKPPARPAGFTVVSDVWRTVRCNARGLAGAAGPGVAWTWDAPGASSVETRDGGAWAKIAYGSDGLRTVTCYVDDASGGRRSYTRTVWGAQVSTDGQTLRSSQIGGQDTTWSLTWTSTTTGTTEVRWDQVGGAALKTPTVQAVPVTEGQQASASIAVRPPASVGGRRVYAFAPRLIDPATGAAIEVEDNLVLVPAVAATAAQTAVAPPRPTWATADIRTAPLAASTDYTGAATQTQMKANVAAQISSWGHIALNAYAFTASCYVVDANTPRYRLRWWDVWDWGWTPSGTFDGAAYFDQVPIPDAAIPAKDTDGHVMFWSPSTDQMWEFWLFHFDRDGQPKAAHGGRIDNYSTSDARFVAPWGVTASGLSWAPIMVTVAEAQAAVAAIRAGQTHQNRIPHTLYMALIYAKSGEHAWPANRSDGQSSSQADPCEGQFLRIDPALDITALGLSPLGLALADAAQRYGAVVADKAGAVNIGCQAGLPEKLRTGVDPWDAILNGQNTWDVLKPIPATAWQVVRRGWHQQFATV